MKTAAPWLIALLLAPVLLMALKRARADYRFQTARGPAEMEAACALDPGRAGCLAALARGLEERGRDARGVWQRVVALNPRSASNLTQAALASEFEGETAEAERLLLAAAQYNQLWLPRWSLANFYYRQGRAAEFRLWARLALERGYGDRTALFRLCREAGVDEGEMLDGLLGEDPANVAAYVAFLTAEGPAGAIPRAAERLLTLRGGAGTGAVLLGAIDALLENGTIEAVPGIWTRMSARGLVPYPAWAESEPLVNPEFRHPPRGAGLDWRIPAQPGVEAFPGVPAGGIKFTFTGQQPERAEILAQEVLLGGGRRWVLEFEYQTPGVEEEESSLGWRVEGAEPGTARERLAAGEWTPGRVRWTIEAGLRRVRLSLTTEREAGRARHAGELRLRALRLRLDEGEAAR